MTDAASATAALLDEAERYDGTNPLDGWRPAVDLRDGELGERAFSAYLACLGRPPTGQDVRALNGALRAYQAAEDTQRRIAAAVRTARAEVDAHEARGVACLAAATRLVASAVRPAEAVEDVHLFAPDLGKLAGIVKELASEFDAWFEERS